MLIKLALRRSSDSAPRSFLISFDLAANNILFLYTNSRSTNYLPGETGPALIKFLDSMSKSPPNVDIPYNKNTTYCFDNESFRYLVASVPPNNIQFDPKFKSNFVESWKRSVDECRRLFNHIIQLPAHKVMDTLSLNNAKQIIQLLTKPLADITKNIADNVKQCKNHRIDVKEFVGTIEELQNKLYIPSVEIISVPLDRPKTVCGDSRCCKRVTITNDLTETKYTTECHSPCYLDFSDGHVVGNKGLLGCKAFNRYSGTDRDPGEPRKSTFIRALKMTGEKIMETLGQSHVCRACGHGYEKHLHIFYETHAKVTKVDANIIDTKIKMAQLAAEAKEQQIRRLDQRIAELKAENETIVQSMSMFACFLANNALTPVNDAFVDYVRHLIANERYGTTGAAGSQTTIKRLEHVLKQYEKEKQIITNAKKSDAQKSVITLAKINECVDLLCSLKHKGPYISIMLDQQRQAKVKHHTAHNQVNYNATDHSGFNKYLNLSNCILFGGTEATRYRKDSESKQ
ncbi:unnamed protein product [Medioppia subpectinata]|uniref:DUF8206 domain-containing protein n=1 Tax=Medioppia subpectinata TaxID=1979941 RepID=A0A7R9KTI2_9ACAR|nr:unnamed protein product [Medioppia subpectinata]CAG2109561.1 unnamed protein product [Medioppia subpectinata]